jgi:hypothetical protein
LNKASLKVAAKEGIILGKNIRGATRIPIIININTEILGLCEISHKGASTLILVRTGLTKFI